MLSFNTAQLSHMIYLVIQLKKIVLKFFLYELFSMYFNLEGRELNKLARL